ncbi:NnrU family protein [Psychromonas ossibalaenae]|uniref:NnrU family protein n=1 Tax=Psychromonas ossibalaenae TaxID=444922 RepID=UPI0003735410|nr:NnrU family protein [Psychromonas ossibalaenae]
MLNLLSGLFLFLGIHSISIIAQPIRDRLAAKNQLVWKAFYSSIALVGLFLIVKGYSQAKLNPTLIYTAPYWLRHVSALLMLPVFILLLAPYFPSKINSITKHPQLFAVMLWAVSHLLVNGSLADLLLFSSFFVWAAADLISMKNRAYRPLPGFKKSAVNDVILVFAGLLIYGLFAVYLHKMLIGISLVS